MATNTFNHEKGNMNTLKELMNDNRGLSIYFRAETLTICKENTKKEIIKIYRNRALPKELWFEKVDNCIKEYQDRVVKKIEMKNNYTDVVLSI